MFKSQSKATLKYLISLARGVFELQVTTFSPSRDLGATATESGSALAMSSLPKMTQIRAGSGGQSLLSTLTSSVYKGEAVSAVLNTEESSPTHPHSHSHFNSASIINHIFSLSKQPSKCSSPSLPLPPFALPSLWLSRPR